MPPNAVAATALTPTAAKLNAASAAVDSAFIQLRNTLDAEARALSELGGEVAFRGTPAESRPLLRNAGELGRVRDHIQFIHGLWSENDRPALKQLQVQKPEGPIRTTSLKQLRRQNGIPAADAARRLGVSGKKLRTWLETGKLKGNLLVGGRWKVPIEEVLRFAREYPDLVGK